VKSKLEIEARMIGDPARAVNHDQHDQNAGQGTG
jgi:hypothetical protein